MLLHLPATFPLDDVTVQAPFAWQVFGSPEFFRRQLTIAKKFIFCNRPGNPTSCPHAPSYVCCMWAKPREAPKPPTTSANVSTITNLRAFMDNPPIKKTGEQAKYLAIKYTPAYAR